MEFAKKVDLVLKVLEETDYYSISIKRILQNQKVDYDDSEILEIERLIMSRSLANNKGPDSGGNNTYALSETGRDFLKTYGTYQKFLKGIELETRKIDRSRKRQSYQAKPSVNQPVAYQAPNSRFNLGKIAGIAVLIFLLFMFYVMAKVI